MGHVKSVLCNSVFWIYVFFKSTDEIHKQIRNRACKTLLGLGKHFKKLDKSGDGTLDKEELLEALKTYRVKLDQRVSSTVTLSMNKMFSLSKKITVF